MARYCKSICISVKENINAFGYKYNTYNWCKSCNAWFKKTITVCPCCKNKLRTRKK